MNQVMTRMMKMSEGEQSNFMRVMFGLSSISPPEEMLKMEWVDESLNESQKDAIRFALGSREVALIHGPPGVSIWFLPLHGWYSEIYRRVKHIRSSNLSSNFSNATNVS